MNETLFNVRIQLKYDSFENWESVKDNFIPRAGEACVVADEDKVTFKIGDGETVFADLPWLSAIASDVEAWAKLSLADFASWLVGEKEIEGMTRPTVATAADIETINEVIINLGEALKAVTDDYLTSADRINLTNAINNRVEKVEGHSLIANTEIERLKNVNNYDDTALAERIGTIEEAAKNHVTATDIENAVKDKADKSVVEAMYTNEQIDELVRGAKDYADNNDADTKYGITYDSENKKIKLVEGGTTAEIDATAFIKDGMIESVALSEDGLNLVITWNTDANKGENNVTEIPLAGLVDVYTGIAGTTVNVTVSSDNKIAAEVKTGSIKDDHIAADAAIAKTKLAADVQTSLGKADTALQEHQDISHLATTKALEEIADDLDEYTNAHANDYTNEAIDEAIKVNTDAIDALGENVDKLAEKTVTATIIEDQGAFYLNNRPLTLVFNCGTATENI